MRIPTPVDLERLLTRDTQPPRWLVEGIFSRGTLVTIAGEPGVGKSLLSYALAYSIALGYPFLGYKTEQATVCYFDEENSAADHTRYNQWIWRGLGCPAPAELKERLHLYHFALSVRCREELVAVARDRRPGLVIIDTATPVFRIVDENDNSEGTRLIQFLRDLQKIARNDTTIHVLKHERERSEVSHRRTIRGAKVWLGAVDRTFYHVALRGRPRKNGLRQTELQPDKLRSFGLEAPLRIVPEWTSAERNGLIFRAKMVSAPLADDQVDNAGK